jgi:excisionase family DNA binding protein
MATASDLLTTQEAAEVLGWSYDYTRKLLAQLHKPTQTIGRNRLWTRDQVEDVAESVGKTIES